MVYITPLVMEKMQFNYFPIISLRELSVAKPNQKADHHNFSYFQRPLPKQHSNQARDKSLQWLWKSCRLKVLTDGQTDRLTDNRQKVFTIAHHEHSSGELKSQLSLLYMMCQLVLWSCSAFLPSIIKMFWRVFDLQSAQHNHCQI